eukprot:763621-Hanusia_phi.AAC.6
MRTLLSLAYFLVLPSSFFHSLPSSLPASLPSLPVLTSLPALPALSAFSLILSEHSFLQFASYRRPPAGRHCGDVHTSGDQLQEASMLKLCDFFDSRKTLE